jgi:sugar/nucleoside kinase (ribokinase family)
MALETRRVYPGSQAAQAGPPDLVVVGAASRDVVADDPRGWRLGGAANYCSLTAARLGLRVGALVGVDRLASTADELGLLEAAGVDLRRIELEHGPVFENIEVDGHRRQRWLSKSDRVPVAALPDEWRGARAWLIVPVAGEVGEEWAGVPPAGSQVGVCWQGLLRTFDEDGWVRRVDPQPSPLLEAAELVVASVDDFEAGTEVRQLRSLAPRAAVVLTAGASGGVAVVDGQMRRYLAIAADRLVDATGAGDVYAAALMAAWLLTGGLATGATLRLAAAAASCSVECAGMAGVPTKEQAAARVRRSLPTSNARLSRRER